MTLQQLHYAIVISQTGSMNKAAEQLYISQPSLTGAVQELEKELGITVFHRSARGVTLTNDGQEFIAYARQVYDQYEQLAEKYGPAGNIKKKFGVTTQHYSFAVKAFVEMVKEFDTSKYEFAIREARTREVIEDVANLRSEIGILYLSDFNGKVLTKLLNANEIEFHELIDCKPYVYLWKGHPLADKKTIRMEELGGYPFLSFEQNGNDSFYFLEEVFTMNEYSQTIRANDRATILNLMVGLNGYTLCSGIICGELNGGDYRAIPLADDAAENMTMRIGYLVKKNHVLSSLAALYIEKIQEYLQNSAEV
ncbi:MAG: LysR family transcriptional regulator [Clostridium sp.]|nr:LysR family transcriptional regulator [Clostridium sp.]